ncbi:MAG TPA: YvcK family protein [Acetivibrio clariflavus]|nr:YvcK family protein [Acetivibrio clariflavus]HPU42123.1 YvcK family protein [Acetivibrio clariflavus]
MKLLNLVRYCSKSRIYLLLGVTGILNILLGSFFVFKCSGIFEMVLPLIAILMGLILICLFFWHLRKITKIYAPKVSSKTAEGDGNGISKDAKIVVIGGGTGLSTMLRGLKEYSSNLTAIVTVADDGGGSGILRQDLGMLPPGDIRNCILALADTEPVMEKLLQYRFTDGMLKGQSFGNLFLAAMNGISENFEEAVKKMSDVLAVTGRVLPVTLQDIKLCAELEDGYIVKGESKIGEHNSFHKGKIKSVYLEPLLIKPCQEAIDAILDADMIVLGPGSLYTSIIPNLLVPGVVDAIKKSKAIKVYVCNVMTQPGETEDYTVWEHIRAIEKHSYKGLVEYCIVNSAPIPDDLKKKYQEEGAAAVVIDSDVLERHGIKVLYDDFVCINNNYIRHDTKKLAKVIMDLWESKCYCGRNMEKVV